MSEDTASKFVDVSKISKQMLRNLDNWENAPVPLCLGGDIRALTFCCKPGYSLTFGYKCMRDEVLEELNISGKEFITIKEKFSKEHQWDADETCFGSLSYCCMRNGGCHRRDMALARRYPGTTFQEAKAEYFRLKKILADTILEYIEKKNR